MSDHRMTHDYDRDKFLCLLMGKKYEPHSMYADLGVRYTDFDDPAQFVELMWWVMKQDWWSEFFWGVVGRRYYHGRDVAPDIRWLLEDPDRFATLVARFNGWRGGK